MLLWIEIVFGILIASGAYATDPCSHLQGASKYVNGKCLTLYKESKNYSDSQIHCEQQPGGGTLAEPRTDAESRAIADLLNANGLMQCYIGVNDQLNEGTYVWGSGEQATSLPWASGQPDNSHVEDCVFILDNNGSHIFLHDVVCTLQINFACQQRVPDPCRHLLPGSEYFDDNCFQMNLIGKTWNEAQEYCEEKGAILAEPKTEELSNFVKDMAERYSANFSIPHVHLGGSVLNYASWVASDEQFTYTNWAASGFLGKYTGYVAMAKSHQWAWIGQQNESMPFICQRDIGDPCHSQFPGATYSLGQCWKFIDAKMTWEDAQATCNDLGAFLAEPKTEDLDEALSRYINSQQAVDVWLGGSDEETESIFKWVTSGEIFTYNHWGGNDPNDGGQGEDHVNMNNRQIWVDSVKTRTLNFVCQKAYNTSAVQRYLAVFPSANDGTTETGTLHISTGLRPGLVYLKITLSKYTEHRKSVSWAQGSVYDIAPTMKVSSTGVFQEHVSIQSSDSITVVLVLHRGDSIGSTLLYPIGIATGHTYFVPSPYKDKVADHLGSILAVASGTWYGSQTQVAIYPQQHQDNSTISAGDVNIMYTGYSEIRGVIKEDFDVMMVSNYSGLNGAFVMSDYGVTVLVGNVQFPVSQQTVTVSQQAVLSSDTNLDYILRAELTDNEYITFPSLPTDPNRMDTYRIIAIHEDTFITVNGGTTKNTIQTVYLASPGDVKDIELPALYFHYVKGNASFYIFKFSVAPVCMTSLFPKSLWKYQYDVVLNSYFDSYKVYIVVIVNNTVPHSFQDCQNIPGTSYAGCHSQLVNEQNQHIQIKNFMAKFGAYLYAVKETSAACHPLGYQDPETFTSFDTEAYLLSHWSDPCTKDSTTTAVPEGTTTQTLAEDTTQSAPEDTTTGSDTTTLTTSAYSAIQEQPNNITLEEAGAFAEEIRRTLKVNARLTSAFKRTKISAEDERISSAVIGVGGVIFIALFGCLILAFDLLSDDPMIRDEEFSSEEQLSS